MSAGSEQAAVEVRIDWQANDIAHRNRQFFKKINFWRDIFPGGLSLRLPESSGEWVSEEFTAGELVPPWSASNIHTVKRSALKLQRKHGPPVPLHTGRHYPRYIAAGLQDIHAGNMQPLRINTIDDDNVIVDLNHVLARVPLAVSARIVEQLGTTGEHGGRCNEPVMDLIDSGVGLETLYPEGHLDSSGGQPFARMDERNDRLFYSEARRVQHIDAMASRQISGIYRNFLAPGMQVLDLMSSWVSHLPDDMDLTITGLGMNEKELASNPRLAQRTLHDLNENPRLPYPDNHFDAVVCTVSIEYLTDPVSVVTDVGRILKPGAPFMVTFSDRWFPTKVIGLWGNLHPFERMALVLDYFRRAGNFRELATESIRGFPRPADDKYADRLSTSDAVFAVSGRAGD